MVKSDSAQPETRMLTLGFRVTAAEAALLEHVGEKLPALTRSGVVRAALALGLEALDLDPGAAMKLPRLDGRTRKGGAG